MTKCTKSQKFKCYLYY